MNMSSGDEKETGAVVVQSGSVSLSQGYKGNWKNIAFNEVEIGEQIGGGSVGLIYRGYYQGKNVALKTLFDSRMDEALKQEYLDELLVLSQLDHPNIVHLHGACMTPPRLFYVMELCEMSLFHLLHQCRRCIATKARLDISRSMAYLHSRDPPIIHRDLKSLNLLLASDNVTVKLCDFGLVRTTVTAAGTPAYMAPELLQGRPFNKTVDVYAFGILLWEIFTREVPFNGYELEDVRETVVSGGRPQVPRGDTPSAVRRLMRLCWSENPSQRPTFSELEGILESALDSSPEEKLQGETENVSGDCLDDLLRR